MDRYILETIEDLRLKYIVRDTCGLPSEVGKPPVILKTSCLKLAQAAIVHAGPIPIDASALYINVKYYRVGNKPKVPLSYMISQLPTPFD